MRTDNKSTNNTELNGQTSANSSKYGLSSEALIKQQKTARNHMAAIKKYGKKNRSITIRINDTVLNLVKEKAKLIGIPYQSLLSSNIINILK